MEQPTILIADDQGVFRERVAALLGGRGYRVLMAADGIQALAVCRREHPKVAILDLVMPHLDGVGVARALRTDPMVPYIPIIFYSRRDQVADKVAALRAGGDDFVGKDVDDEELVARVESQLRVRRMLDSRRTARSASDEQSVVNLTRHVDAERALAEQLDQAQKGNSPLSLLLITTDDTDARARLGELVREATRATDIIARFDDDSCGIIVPNIHFGGALAQAERIWRTLPPKSKRRGGLTIGVACFPNRKIDSATTLLEFARAALDRARAEGPGNICLYHHQAYIFRPDE